MVHQGEGLGRCVFSLCAAVVKVRCRIVLTDGEKSLTEMKHREQTSAAELNANERLRSADLTLDD